MMPCYKFYVVEGCNGVGKSTVVAFLKEQLGAVSFHYPPEFLNFRRAVKLDQSISALPRMTYYLAATLHLSDLVRDQLVHGHVVCDRYLASPLSLLIAEEAVEESEALKLITPFKSHLISPEITLHLTAEHQVASERIQRRHGQTGKMTPVAQRTLESAQLFRKREKASIRIAGSLGPLVCLDTSELSIDQMCAEAWAVIAETH